MTATVTTDGSIPIPQVLRDELGLRPGSVLELVTQNGQLVGRKQPGENPFSRWRGRGRLPAGATNTDDYLREARDADRR